MAFDEDYFVFSPNNYVAKFILYIYSGPFGGAYFDYLEHVSIENVY